MANILDTLLYKAAKDFVGVYDQDGIQVFPKARPLKATVREESRPMEHPLESGAIITDHRIILPVEIELSLILNSSDYQDVYKTIRQYYLNATFLVVQTNSDEYRNQLIQSIPHEESPDQFGTITLALKLKQVQIVSARFGVVPRDPVNLTTVDTGTQQGQATTPAQSGSVLGGFL